MASRGRRTRRSAGGADQAGPARALLAALGLLAACNALAQPLADAASAYRPAQRTALATDAQRPFMLARQQAGDTTTTVLAWLPPAGLPEPVARLTQRRDADTLVVAVQLLAPPGAGDRLTATLEQLYALVLRQEPQARYCLWAGPAETGSPPAPCAGPTLSHAEALQHLAAWRTQAAQATPAAVPWQVLALQAVPQPAWDADLVAVQASGPQGPLAGLEVFFHRAPHSICQARTGDDGVARCRLQDQHDDGHLHDHTAAVVATFPGDLRPDRVWLPTTQVLRPQAALAAPAFASRWLPSGRRADP